MSLNVIVPTVGESISEVTLAKCHKKTGEFVNQNDLLCELESDKATFELNAEQSGIITWVANEGDTLAVGASLCTIEASSGFPTVQKENNSSVATTQVAQPSATGQILEMKVPAVGESITEVTIANWTKKDGDFVSLNDVLCEIESDKATFELTAEASGKLTIIAKTGETLPIGALMCKIEVMEGVVSSASTISPSASPSTATTTSS
ncbi:MAG: biotin/lipoyl-containing protein, partial [Cytophagales bacterium]